MPQERSEPGKEALHRYTLLLHSDLHQALRQEADRKGTPLTRLIRRYVEIKAEVDKTILQQIDDGSSYEVRVGDFPIAPEMCLRDYQGEIDRITLPLPKTKFEQIRKTAKDNHHSALSYINIAIAFGLAVSENARSQGISGVSIPLTVGDQRLALIYY